METKNLQILVEEMEEILTRPLFTERDRNDVLFDIRLRLKELKDVTQQNYSTATSNISHKGLVTEGNKPVDSQHVLNKWKICECGKTHCKTCEAEREAQRSAISWMNQPSHVDEQKESKKANQQHHFEMSENCTKAGIECKESGDELKSNTQRNMPEHCGDLEKENTYSKKSHMSSDEENENDYTFYKVEFDEEEYNSQKRKDSHSDVKNTKVMTGGNSSFSDDFSPQSSGEMTRMEQARQGQKFLVFLSGNIPPNFTVRFSQPVQLQRRDNPIEVSCIVDATFHETGFTTKNIIRLSAIFSAYKKLGESEPHACGVIVLMFSVNMLDFHQSSLITSMEQKDFLAIDVADIVVCSLEAGFNMFMDNCKDSDQCLGLQDVLLLSSGMGVELKEDKVVHEYVIEVFADHLMSLTPGQILLLFRMNNYNVISAVCRKVNKDILIFDCLSHTETDHSTNEETEYGAFIYQILERKANVVKRTLKLLEKHSGKMIGHCVIALLETEERR